MIKENGLSLSPLRSRAKRARDNAFVGGRKNYPGNPVNS
jgi:hypothetical protein